MRKKIACTTLLFIFLSVSSSNGQSLSDFLTILQSYQKTPSTATDKNNDAQVNTLDFAWFINKLAQPTNTTVPTPGVTFVPAPTGNSWTQLAGNAQYTGFINSEPSGKNWSFAWHWKPSDMYSMPRSAHAVVGNGKLYMPGGAQGLYVVDISTGNQVCRLQNANYQAAGAFDEASNYLYIAATDGKVYKVSPNCSVASSFQASAAFDLAVTVVGNYVYVPDTAGNLYKLDKNSLAQIWKYAAGTPADTPAAYSASRGLLIFGTRDLKVHGVNDSSGTAKWSRSPVSVSTDPKYNIPSQITDPCSPYTYRFGWPVVADSAGIVFLRIRLGSQNDWLYSGRPGTNKYPTTNAETRTWLDDNPKKKPLFALSLDTGSNAFTPAVANGGVDGDTTFPCPDRISGTKSTIGPMPVIKNISGQDFAYIFFRNSQTTNPDWDERWDSHMGEMVLSNNAIAGYGAGDLRFVNFGHNNLVVSDEVSPITLAGNTLFYAHWGLIESYTITNRANALGNVLSNSITTTKNPPTIRRLKTGGGQSNRWTTGILDLFCDTRSWPGPGWWMYFNESDPPGTGNAACTDYRGGMLPRYSFVSNNYIFHVGHGGDVFALRF